LHIHKFQNRLILLLRNCDHEITCCFGNCWHWNHIVQKVQTRMSWKQCSRWL
jgi:hypothetical protein